VYLAAQDPPKRARLLSILATCQKPVVSTQVLVEVGANLCKKARVTEPQHRAILDDIVSQVSVVPVVASTLRRASYLRDTGIWSYWDSVIVAAAIEAGCSELWTEDLQDGQVIQGALRIVSPFRQPASN
jgi:predicted nucleic acid-binding protein